MSPAIQGSLRMFRLIASLALAALLAQPAGAAPFRLIVTDLEPPLVPNSVMDVALSLGYFAREGVNVELVRVQQTPLAVVALQAGEGEMANIGIDTALQLAASGQLDLRAVMSPSKSLFFMIVGSNAVADVAALPGHSFGIGRPGSVDQALSRHVLAAEGLDISTLEQVALGQPSARAQALAARQIDATTLSLGSWTTLPDRTGLHVLVDADAYFAAAPVVSKVNVVSADVLAERRDDVVAVVAALTRLSRDIAANPTIWVDAMAAARPDLPRADLESLAVAYDGNWSVNGGLSAETLAFTADWTFNGADFVGIEPITLSQWVDFSIVDTVLAEIGTAPDSDPADR